MSLMSKHRAAPANDWFGDERDSRGFERPASASLTLRMRVAAGRGRLTRELAEGADPASSAELALRAAQLTSQRRSEELVRTLDRAIREAHTPHPPAPVVVISRRAVLGAEDAIEAMIARLGYAEPVQAQGMAIAEQMITDGVESPLYSSDDPGALRRRVLVALEALDAAPGQGRQLAAVC
jgi:hypothetical protein